jgi:hypothetical protein
MFEKKVIRKLVKRFVRRENIPYKFLEEPFFYRFPDSKKIEKLKNKFRGKRCFILGNGPSLNKIDLGKIENEYSFAVNGIFYKTEETGYRPTFYVVEDHFVMLDNLKEINAYDAEYKFFPINYKSYVKPSVNTAFFRMNTGFYEKQSPNFAVPRFSTDAAKRLFCGQSVTMINLQLAYYFGFSEIYLIGMDFDYQIPDTAIFDGDNIESTEDDPNHFHPDYFGKGKKWHDPHLDRVLNSYKMNKVIYEADGRKIYNATAGGKLELFERKRFEDIFSG